MRFLDPVFLAGLGAVAVPIALHLLFRRRVPVMVFPLVRLVEKAERSRQPRRRLNRVLLLCARVALLAVLSLALARLTLGPAPVVAAAGPVALIVVLDDSLSMRAVGEDGRTAFETGVAEARRVLEALPAGSASAVVLASDPRAAESTGLSSEVATSRIVLDAARPSMRHVRLDDALLTARRLLAAASLEDRRVVLVSDLARHAFEALSLPDMSGQRPRLVLLAPPAPPERTNRSVAAMEAGSLPDGRVRATVRVAAWGGATDDVRLEVHVGQDEDRARLAGRASVAPRGGASVERRFDLAPSRDEGWLAVTARLEEDFLPDDDRRHAVTAVARPPRVLVVDGDPQSLSFGSETFYLERALSPGVGLDLAAEFIAIGELHGEDLARHDVVVLCNVPELSGERTEQLVAAVRQGVGVVVALGNRVDQPTWNGRLAPVLPATLSLVVSPAVAEAFAPGAFAVPRVRVRRYFRLVPDAGARVLARSTAGAPLLVEGRVGRGRVVVFATTLDRDWTDLPISPHYLRFIRALVDRVSTRARGRVPAPVTVGDPVSLAAILQGREPPYSVRTPDGRDVSLEPDGTFSSTDVAGIHVAHAGGEAATAFAVVTDPRESDLARHSPREVADLVGASFELSEDAGEAAGGGGRAAWKWLLVALVGLAFSEGWLARRAA